MGRVVARSGLCRGSAKRITGYFRDKSPEGKRIVP